MLTINVTVTGKVGPDKTLTAQVFNAVRSFTVPTNAVLELVDVDGHVWNIDIGAATTFTVTIAGDTYTVAIS